MGCSLNLGSLLGQQTINIEYVFADKSYKQSGHFSHSCSVRKWIRALSSVFYKHAAVLHSLWTHPSLPNFPPYWLKGHSHEILLRTILETLWSLFIQITEMVLQTKGEVYFSSPFRQYCSLDLSNKSFNNCALLSFLWSMELWRNIFIRLYETRFYYSIFHLILLQSHFMAGTQLSNIWSSFQQLETDVFWQLTKELWIIPKSFQNTLPRSHRNCAVPLSYFYWSASFLLHYFIHFFILTVVEVVLFLRKYHSTTVRVWLVEWGPKCRLRRRA